MLGFGLVWWQSKALWGGPNATWVGPTRKMRFALAFGQSHLLFAQLWWHRCGAAAATAQWPACLTTAVACRNDGAWLEHSCMMIEISRHSQRATHISCISGVGCLLPIYLEAQVPVMTHLIRLNREQCYPQL